MNPCDASLGALAYRGNCQLYYGNSLMRAIAEPSGSRHERDAKVDRSTGPCYRAIRLLLTPELLLHQIRRRVACVRIVRRPRDVRELVQRIR